MSQQDDLERALDTIGCIRNADAVDNDDLNHLVEWFQDGIDKVWSRDPYLGRVQTENVRLRLRCDGYQGSRDYAIDTLAGALGVDADKVRAVEYYAQQAANEIERLVAIVARMHHTVDGVPVFGNDRIYHPEYRHTTFSVNGVELMSSFRVSDCYSTRELADNARVENHKGDE